MSLFKRTSLSHSYRNSHAGAFWYFTCEQNVYITQATQHTLDETRYHRQSEKQAHHVAATILRSFDTETQPDATAPNDDHAELSLVRLCLTHGNATHWKLICGLVPLWCLVLVIVERSIIIIEIEM